MSSERLLYRNGDVISLSTSDSDPDSDQEPQTQTQTSGVQVPSSSPFKNEGRLSKKQSQTNLLSRNVGKSSRGTEMDSSPIRGSQAPRLASLTEKFSYKPGGGSMLKSKKDNRISGIESAKNLKLLRAEFPSMNPAELLSSLKISSSVSSAIKRIKQDIKNRKNRVIRIDDDSDDLKSDDFDSDAEIRLDSSPRKEIDVVSSKVTLGKHGRLVDRYRKKILDSPTTKRRHNSSEPEETVISDDSDDPLSAAFQKTKKRKLKRGTRDSFIGYDNGGSISTRSKRFTRVPTIELSSESQDDEESENKAPVKTKVPLKRGFSAKNRAPPIMEVKAIELSDDPESEGSEEEFTDSEDADLDMDQKTLKFLNNADIRDIVDIAGITPTIAKQFIDKRPFEFLEDIEEAPFEDPTKKNNGKRTNVRKSIGEKIVETTSVKLKGYEAVNSLVKKCHEYGRTITKEIRKWGVTIEGEGELKISEVNVPTNESESEDSEEDISDSDATSKPSRKIDDIMLANYNDSDNSDDEDFVNSKKKVKSSSKNGNFNSTNKSNNPIGYFKKQPKLISKEYQLKGYQQVGINWLNLLYQKNLSCILADEMGLGKTLQVIAFLSHLKQKKISGPHLIVVPSSTLENWLREFEKFSPTLDVRPYYGTQSEREELRYELESDDTYDVLVTTYNLATGNKYDLAFLRSRKFNAIVYDEGHMLKNSNSERYVKLMRLRANFRLLLTGTPLQNNLRELVSLLSFILPGVFNDRKEDFQVIFDQKSSTRTSSKEELNEEDQNFNPLLSQQAIKKAKTMMAPFVLRRKKDQVMKHLPAKHQEIAMCRMTPLQSKIYRSQIAMADVARNERERRKKLSAEENKGLPKLNSPTNVLMLLRKAAIHPLLFRTFYDDTKLRSMAKAIMSAPQYIDANEEFIFEDMSVMTDFELNELCHSFSRELGGYYMEPKAYLKSGKIQKMMEIVNQVLERKEKVLVFSLFTQVLDILEKVLSLNHIKFVRLDGQTSVEERQTIIDTFYKDQEIPVFLLSTKAGGFGINLVAANNVIIFDQSFNPHDDKQAEDRAHRVGQTKEVHVYKLICENTIEQNILQMAYEKLQLDNSMMNEASVFNENDTTKLIENILFSKEGSAKQELNEEDPDAQDDEIRFENPDFVPPAPPVKSTIDNPIVVENDIDDNLVKKPVELVGNTVVPSENNEISSNTTESSGMTLVMETINNFVKAMPTSFPADSQSTVSPIPLFIQEDSEIPSKEGGNQLAIFGSTVSASKEVQPTISHFFRKKEPTIKESISILNDSGEDVDDNEKENEKDGSVYEEDGEEEKNYNG